MEDPRLETVPGELADERDVVKTTSSGRVTKPPDRLGFDVPRHMLAGARSKTPPRSPHSHIPQVREHMEGEQTTRKYRSVDDLDIEGLSKLKPADRQAIKNKAVETLNEIRRVIPSKEGTREPESPDPQVGNTGWPGITWGICNPHYTVLPSVE